VDGKNELIKEEEFMRSNVDYVGGKKWVDSGNSWWEVDCVSGKKWVDLGSNWWEVDNIGGKKWVD
jgi:hypothetical protein